MANSPATRVLCKSYYIYLEPNYILKTRIPGGSSSQQLERSSRGSNIDELIVYAQGE